MLLQGIPYLIRLEHDLVAWLDWLRARAGPRVGLLGHSSGAVKAVYAAAHETQLGAACLIAVSPPRLSYTAFCQSANAPQFLETFSEAERLVQAPGEAEFPGGSETILVVEDDTPLRDLVVRMLQDAGYRVIAAKGAETALEIVKASDPAIDLLLTDVIMPGIGGAELLEQAKLIRPELHSLLMSGYTGELVALRRGIVPESAFLEKPFTRRSLLGKVRSALRSETGKP